MNSSATPTPITTQLLDHADAQLRDFNARLVPTVASERFIGVRMAPLRMLASTLHRDESKHSTLVESFYTSLPHHYVEEDILHMLLINAEPTPTNMLRRLDAFLPYVDNWMVCDALAPKAAIATTDGASAVEKYCEQALEDRRTYVRRAGCVLLLRFFLDEHFSPKHLQWVAAAGRIAAAQQTNTSTTDGDYYTQMAVGWYFAEALAKQPEPAWPYFRNLDSSVGLDPACQLLAIRKAIESRRISATDKEHLRTLRHSLRQAIGQR